MRGSTSGVDILVATERVLSPEAIDMNPETKLYFDLSCLGLIRRLPWESGNKFETTLHALRYEETLLRKFCCYGNGTLVPIDLHAGRLHLRIEVCKQIYSI